MARQAWKVYQSKLSCWAPLPDSSPYTPKVMPWTVSWIIILEYGVPTNETTCSHRKSRRTVYGLCPPDTLKELLWKLLEQHLTSRRCSPHRGKGFSFVAHPLQGKCLSSYVLKLEMDIIVLLSPFITLMNYHCLMLRIFYLNMMLPTVMLLV